VSVPGRLRRVLSPNLREVPLRTKLVVSVLTLVFAALTLISAGSTLALHNYLVGRTDTQLKTLAASVEMNTATGYLLTPDYFVAEVSTTGVGRVQYDKRDLGPDDVPAVVKGVDNINARLDQPYTTRSPNGTYWRMLITALPNNTILQLGLQMSGIDLAIGHLIWVDVLVGAGVMIALATVGAAVVRQTLVPLRDIERSATCSIVEGLPSTA